MRLVQLPDPLRSAITMFLIAGVTWLVVEGFKMLGEAFHKDFSVMAKTVAAIVSSAVVSVVLGIFDALLALIPSQYEVLANAILSLLVILVASLSAMGIHRFVKMKKLGIYG